MVKKESKGKGKKGGKGKGTKKTKGGPKVKGKKLPKLAECLHPSEMSKGQLMGHMKRLMAEKDRELEERNLFMLEKRKLWAIWQLTIEKMSILKDQVRDMEIKIQVSKKDKDKENEIQTKKLRMLQTEEVKNFSLVRLNHLHYTKNISNDIWAIENILRESSLHQKKRIRRALASYYEIIRGLRLTHAQSISAMLKTLSESIVDFESEQDRKFFERKLTWEENFTPSMDMVKNKKHSTVDVMMIAHERAILEMKTFFDDVTTNNLAIMTSLVEEIEEQKLKENRLGRDLHWAKENFKNIHEPLQRMIQEMKSWIQPQQSLKTMLTQLATNEKLLKKKQHCAHMEDVSNECVRQQISIGLVERDKARVEFGKTITTMQRQAQMKSLIYQLKGQAPQKDEILFKSVVKNITKAPNDPTDYFQQLKNSRVEEMKEMTTTFKNFENFASDPIELECIEQQDAVDLGSVGLQNKIGVIHQPWRKLQPNDSRSNCCRPRYKDILHPNNIFNQLPQLVLKPSINLAQAKTSQSLASNLSGASTGIISIYPPKTLSNITSKRSNSVNRKFPTVHQTVTRDNLQNALEKVEWKIQHEPSCDLNFDHLLPKKNGNTKVRPSQKCPILKKPRSILKAKCIKSQYMCYY